MDDFAHLNGANAAYIDELYQKYRQNSEDVDFGWQLFFEGFDFGQANYDESGEGPKPGAGTVPDAATVKEINVLNLIEGYRSRGHLFTHTNPVRERRKHLPTLELENFKLSEADLDIVFQAGAEIGIGPATLRQILEVLQDTYTNNIGAEYRFLRTPEVLRWLQQKMESTRNHAKFTADQKKQILRKLNEAVVFESFLGTKFLGQKRFSLEGAEGLIPALDSVITTGSELGIEEFVIGMAHRGRLNVLTNILHKSYVDMFAEFEGKSYDESWEFGGDVKYHLGYSTDVTLQNGKHVHLSLCPNPSHLETVDGITEGVTRSKVDFKYKDDNSKIAPILIHGDAAVAGQGIVYEVIQMAGLDGYKTGGTIHLVINNQIGFTTNYKDGRTSTYCTDIAKVTLSPVFHVNGDDVESLVYAINLAMEYRQKYRNDVFIDILCYRRFGHNESDEPKFTQPLLYKIIEKHANPKVIYTKQLVAEGVIDEGFAKDIEKELRGKLQADLDSVRASYQPHQTETFGGAWADLRLARKGELAVSPDTAVDEATLLQVGGKISTLPKDLVFFKKIEKLYEERRRMVTESHVFDWAMGEQLAYGTLLLQGIRVRISGQDVERGTFSHRHAVLTLEDKEQEYVPLQHVAEGQAQFDIYNSHLSEYGVLGFEYGYAMANPNALVIWEAQFGDFANGAQIIIDQYISSSETKWQRGNGLVMLLPHGYEGQGPEHSSARIERYMELCADNNMQVCNFTTPANLFHALRRQFARDFRKPLIVFTPKSLLRHPKCVSPMADFTHGGFKEVIDDTIAPENVYRVVLCSGKIYYELLEKREAEGLNYVALVRVEQLYPLPYEQMLAAVKRYPNATQLAWVQEEPENQGAWPFMLRKLRKTELSNIEVICRKESSSTAVGYAKMHALQQAAIIAAAFAQKPDAEDKKIAEEAVQLQYKVD